MERKPSISELIASATREPEVLKEEEIRIRKERTIQKYNRTQIRIEEIEEKISRLQKEKENLVRKQESRRNFLQEL